MAVIFTDSMGASANNGWTGYSIRQLIPKAALTNPGFNTGSIRASFLTAATAGPMNIDAMWIGPSITSPVYDYDGTQVRLTFGGANFINGLGASSTTVSDFIPFTFNFASAIGILICFHLSGTSANLAQGTDVSGSADYYQLVATGPEGTTAPSGTWTLDASPALIGINEIDFSAPGQITAVAHGAVMATTQPRGIVPLYG